MSASKRDIDLVPEYGQHAFILGRTGSGKTAFARWLLRHVPGTIVYDTKGEPKFDRISRVVVDNVKDAMKAIEEEDYVVIRPPVYMLTEPLMLDDMLLDHYHTGANVTAYIDEGYQFHKGSQAGPGLISLLTRGRSKGISTIVSSQRPAWVSRFSMSEANRFYVFGLTDKRDHKTVAEFIPHYMPEKTPKYHFQYYAHDLDEPVLMAPVPFDEGEGSFDTDGQKNNLPSGWI